MTMTYEGDDEPDDVEDTERRLKLTTSSRRVDSSDICSGPVDERQRCPEGSVRHDAREGKGRSDYSSEDTGDELYESSVEESKRENDLRRCESSGSDTVKSTSTRRNSRTRRR